MTWAGSVVAPCDSTGLEVHDRMTVSCFSPVFCLGGQVRESDEKHDADCHDADVDDADDAGDDYRVVDAVA